jgi:CO/xanthine dehydrogenase FAD-binding subunit
MPAIVSTMQVYTPATAAEAVAFLAEHRGEGWRPLAGGTDVMMGLYRDRRGGHRWLNIARLRDTWGRIAWDGEELRIGVLATMADLRTSTAALAAHPLIGEAARVVGAVQIQNRATVGGNIANGSPAGDTLPVWLALDAEIELTSQRGPRRVAFERFMTGYRQSVMESDELLTAVMIPRPQPGRHWYLFRKVAPRAAQGISKVVFAATGILEPPGSGAGTRDDIAEDDNSRIAPITVTNRSAPTTGPVGTWRQVRLAWGSMGPVTTRSYAAEHCAEGRSAAADVGSEAAALLDRDLHPIDDARSTAVYRSAVARNLAREFLAGQLGQLWQP